MELYEFQAILLFAASFSGAVVQTSVYSYISSMVMDLGMSGTRNETGYYVGILGSMTLVGRAFSSPIWGYFADSIGRKRSLEVSLLAIVIFNIGFGLSTNYWWAVVMRLLTGLSSGINIVGKAAASELGPKEYKAKAMVWYSLGNNLGLTLGTAIGGLMVHLEQVLPFLPAQVPYLWPNLFISLSSFGILVLVYFYFKETLIKKETHAEEVGWSQYRRIFQMPEVHLLSTIFILNACMGTAMSELVPLWCWADRSHGGLNYTTVQIGLVFSIASFAIMFFQAFIYAELVRRYGQVSLAQMSLVFMMPIIALQVENRWLGPTLELPGVVFGVFLFRLMYTTNETSLNLLTNHAVPMNFRGKFNGFLTSLVSATRAFVPALFGWGFAFSLEDWPYPFDVHLMFYILVLISAFCLYLSYKLNHNLEVDYEDRSKLLKDV